MMREKRVVQVDIFSVDTGKGMKYDCETARDCTRWSRVREVPNQ